MNVNDPYIIAALAHWTGDPSPLDIDWRAQGMREADADRAVLARRKAGERRHIAAIVGTTEWVHDRPNLNDGRLPEAAFSWPIYRAGYSQSTDDCESRGHVEFAYGPPDEDESVIEQYQRESR